MTRTLHYKGNDYVFECHQRGGREVSWYAVGYNMHVVGAGVDFYRS